MSASRHTIVLLALAGGLSVAGSAGANVAWNFTGGGTNGIVASANTCTNPNNSNRTTYGNCGEWAATSSSPSGSPNVQVTAWSNTNTNGGAVSGDSRVLQDAYLAVWSGGVGVVNRAEATGTSGGTPTVSQPQHAVDNNGSFDSILLRFDSAVTLSGVRIGWPDGTYDTDISVLAYTPTESQPSDPSVAGLRYQQLVTSGWTLVGHYANADIAPNSTDPAFTVNTQGVSSRFFMVAAYNPLVGGTSSTALTSCNRTSGGVHCDSGNDYMKILGVTASTPPGRVAEPHSAMLLGMVAGAAWWTRRRKKV